MDGILAGNDEHNSTNTEEERRYVQLIVRSSLHRQINPTPWTHVATVKVSRKLHRGKEYETCKGQ